VADAVEAARQDVQEKAADELGGVERHGAEPVTPAWSSATSRELEMALTAQGLDGGARQSAGFGLAMNGALKSDRASRLSLPHGSAPTHFGDGFRRRPVQARDRRHA
jgi:hypothetical protein